MRSFTAVALLVSVLVAVLPVKSLRRHQAQPASAAQGRLEGLPSPFVPNLGQWQHRGKFIHRAGPMTVFLEERGWVLDLVEPQTKEKPDRFRSFPAADAPQRIRGVALRMTFEGDAYVPEILGEEQLPGHHNYFLGNDESCWRTGVPLYASVRYQGLYPGIDLRLRQVNGVPEYDMLLEPGADLLAVSVHVEGGQDLSIADDGSLVVETKLGPLTQPRPKTFEVGRDGRKREVACHFRLLGPDRFGFLAPGWAGDTSLTIDPGLIWSTFLGASRNEGANAISVDTRGVVTVAGTTESSGFPMKPGAYDTTWNHGSHDAFVSRLDPSKTASQQLIYSTFLGGSGYDEVWAISVDAGGVVTVTGRTDSSNLPTRAAFSATYNGGKLDAFVSRLDPRKNKPSQQLVYSTYLGGSGADDAPALAVDANGVVTLAGLTSSTDFPTTAAYDATHNGNYDAFVSRLDPSKSGSVQLVYSTFLGGSHHENGSAVSVDSSGVVTVAGFTFSSNFPTTTGTYDATFNGTGANPPSDAFVSRLDPRKKKPSQQLVYSTFLGGLGSERIIGLFVDAKTSIPKATVTGWTQSSDFPTTTSAYDTTWNRGTFDAFVSRLMLGNLGKTGLVYSTFLGGSGDEGGSSLSVDAGGVVTVTGPTTSENFPTTPGAHDTSHNGGKAFPGGDGFVSRLDPNKPANKQLIYSTFLGGSDDEASFALSVDASGVATVAGFTNSKLFPTTSGAYDTTYNGSSGPPPVPTPHVGDVFVSRLDMGVALYGDVHEISLNAGGTQKLTVNAGKAHSGRSYWVFGSVTGTTPGVTIGPLHIPLNPDIWTDYTIALANTAVLTNTKGTLDRSGTAQATFNIPKISLPSAIGLVFHHAYLVHDTSGRIYLASNAVPLKLVK